MATLSSLGYSADELWEHFECRHFYVEIEINLLEGVVASVGLLLHRSEDEVLLCLPSAASPMAPCVDIPVDPETSGDPEEIVTGTFLLMPALVALAYAMAMQVCVAMA